MSLPLDAAKAAVVIRQQFTAAQINELVPLLHGRCPGCYPPVEEAPDHWIPPTEPDPFDDPITEQEREC